MNETAYGRKGGELRLQMNATTAKAGMSSSGTWLFPSYQLFPDYYFFYSPAPTSFDGCGITIGNIIYKFRLFRFRKVSFMRIYLVKVTLILIIILPLLT